jgi:hypothetical protein
MKAFELIARKGTRGKKLFRFVQFHVSLAAATDRGARMLAEQGLELLEVAELDAAELERRGMGWKLRLLEAA